MKIIGVAGSFASGKDTMADYLVDSHGFYHVSTSDLVRNEAMNRYGSNERPILYQTANEIRTERGHGALSEMALEEYQSVKKDFPNGLVVTGFRAAAEAEVIKKNGGIIVFIDAPFEVRYDRMQKRARDKESIISKEEFTQRERRENGGENSAFNISKIKDIADYTYDNTDSLQKFHETAEKILTGTL